MRFLQASPGGAFPLSMEGTEKGAPAQLHAKSSKVRLKGSSQGRPGSAAVHSKKRGREGGGGGRQVFQPSLLCFSFSGVPSKSASPSHCLGR